MDLFFDKLLVQSFSINLVLCVILVRKGVFFIQSLVLILVLILKLLTCDEEFRLDLR